MSEEKKIESGTGASATDNSNLIPDPKPPIEENTIVGGDKSGFKGAATDEGKKEETPLQKSYNELETKFGHQGKELGDFRSFFKEISPLLDKLDAQPELIQAIIDGKVDSSLAKAAVEGKISIQDAKAVTKAHEEIKKEVGKKDYEDLSPEQIEEKILEKVNEKVNENVKKLGENISKNVKKTTDEAEERREYSDSIDKFIEKTEDFPEYAEAINKWISDNPEQDDIKIAYRVVKGIALEKKAKENDKINQGEEAKKIAANAGGGGSQGGTVVNDKNIVDQFIGNSSNPNVF